MSSYLKLCTETADLIEFGQVQEDAAHNYSDFERLLGLKEARQQQQRKIDEKREQSLREIEASRAARVELREMMQRARNEQLVAQIKAEKEQKEQEMRRNKETTLKQKLEEALSQKGVQQNGGSKLISSSSSSSSASSASTSSSDPFLRFRAEDSRVRADRERVESMRKLHGTSGCDLLRRFVEGATAWSLHDGESSIVDASGHLNARDTVSVGSSPISPASTSSCIPAAVALPRVPTAANLVSAGLGNAKAAEVSSRSLGRNLRVKKELDSLEKKDAADFAEWQHRRAFYDRERIKVLEEMHAAGLEFRSRFSSTAVDPLASLQKGAVLGHNAEQKANRVVFTHPVDEYHAVVRDSVIKIQSASNPWTAISGQHAHAVSGSLRAAASSAQLKK